MPPHSRNKGKRGELEFSDWLRARGIEARRGQQFAGGPGSPDVVTDLDGVHVEVKRTERLLLWKAMDQAVADAPAGDIPVIAHRPNRRPWVAVLSWEDFLRLLVEARRAGPP